MARIRNIDKRVEKIIEQAEEMGLLDNLMFETLLNTFTDQRETLQRLKKQIDADEVLVAKEHTRGLTNTVVNPCISAYNSTANAMCNTVSAMAKVLKEFSEKEEEPADELAEILKG